MSIKNINNKRHSFLFKALNVIVVEMLVTSQLVFAVEISDQGNWFSPPAGSISVDQGIMFGGVGYQGADNKYEEAGYDVVVDPTTNCLTDFHTWNNQFDILATNLVFSEVASAAENVLLTEVQNFNSNLEAIGYDFTMGDYFASFKDLIETVATREGQWNQNLSLIGGDITIDFKEEGVQIIYEFREDGSLGTTMRTSDTETSTVISDIEEDEEGKLLAYNISIQAAQEVLHLRYEFSYSDDELVALTIKDSVTSVLQFTATIDGDTKEIIIFDNYGREAITQRYKTYEGLNGSQELLVYSKIGSLEGGAQNWIERETAYSPLYFRFNASSNTWENITRSEVVEGERVYEFFISSEDKISTSYSRDGVFTEIMRESYVGISEEIPEDEDFVLPFSFNYSIERINDDGELSPYFEEMRVIPYELVESNKVSITDQMANTTDMWELSSLQTMLNELQDSPAAILSYDSSPSLKLWRSKINGTALEFEIIDWETTQDPNTGTMLYQPIKGRLLGDTEEIAYNEFTVDINGTSVSLPLLMPDVSAGEVQNQSLTVEKRYTIEEFASMQADYTMSLADFGLAEDEDGNYIVEGKRMIIVPDIDVYLKEKGMKRDENGNVVPTAVPAFFQKLSEAMQYGNQYVSVMGLSTIIITDGVSWVEMVDTDSLERLGDLHKSTQQLEWLFASTGNFAGLDDVAAEYEQLYSEPLPETTRNARGGLNNFPDVEGNRVKSQILTALKNVLENPATDFSGWSDDHLYRVIYSVYLAKPDEKRSDCVFDCAYYRKDPRVDNYPDHENYDPLGYRFEEFNKFLALHPGMLEERLEFNEGARLYVSLEQSSGFNQIVTGVSLAAWAAEAVIIGIAICNPVPGDEAAVTAASAAANRSLSAVKNTMVMAVKSAAETCGSIAGAYGAYWSQAMMVSPFVRSALFLGTFWGLSAGVRTAISGGSGEDIYSAMKMNTTLGVVMGVVLHGIKLFPTTVIARIGKIFPNFCNPFFDYLITVGQVGGLSTAITGGNFSLGMWASPYPVLRTIIGFMDGWGLFISTIYAIEGLTSMGLNLAGVDIDELSEGAQVLIEYAPFLLASAILPARVNVNVRSFLRICVDKEGNVHAMNTTDVGTYVDSLVRAKAPGAPTPENAGEYKLALEALYNNSTNYYFIDTGAVKNGKPIACIYTDGGNAVPKNVVTLITNALGITTSGTGVQLGAVVQDSYSLLGMNRSDIANMTATEADSFIKLRFRLTAKQLHPDHAPTARRPEFAMLFSQMRSGYEQIKTAETRLLYDAVYADPILSQMSSNLWYMQWDWNCVVPPTPAPVLPVLPSPAG